MKKNQMTNENLKLSWREVRDQIISSNDDIEGILDKMDRVRTNRELRVEQFLPKRVSYDEENYFFMQ
jgi:hypothetical protein